MTNKDRILKSVNESALSDEKQTVSKLLNSISLNEQQLNNISNKAKTYITKIRENKGSEIESFIQQYSLSNEEGVAIMCLAEALLRIPDLKTANELIEDKLKNKNWTQHLGKSRSFLVNASAWGLALTGKIIDMSESKFSLARFFNKLSEPIIFVALKQAIKLISNEFIMGSSMPEAIKRARNYGKHGFNISFDILGESSRTQAQADFYYEQYINAISEISQLCNDSQKNIFSQPNISVKLTALHPRVELVNEARVENELLPKLIEIIKLCYNYNISISFDAEEAFRLNIYLKVIEKLIAFPEFHNYHGIGVVIQSYQKRAFHVIDYIIELAKASNKRIPLRLVKGAYWDSEIKRSQELGLLGYPVFTNKEFTDLSYIACAQKILQNIDYIYPQFATHNAYTVSIIQELAKGLDFEFQKLQGMGNILHEALVQEGYNSRIYAPVGKYEDLLAYLMRRLLENGANTSFINLVGENSVSLEQLLSNPIERSAAMLSDSLPLPLPEDIYGNSRKNSAGFDIGFYEDKQKLEAEISKFKDKKYEITSIINGEESYTEVSSTKIIHKPANNIESLGKLHRSTTSQLQQSLTIADQNFENWSLKSPFARAEILENIADLYSENRYELYSILIKEGGKNIYDSIAEVREAIDFARYYANQVKELLGKPILLPGYTGESNELRLHGKGIFVCISPWNFPLAIFSGQIFAALGSGNTVIAKPAENTSIIAAFAVRLMHKAGIPKGVLQLALASGKDIGNVLLTDSRVSGVCFTGSTEIAQNINRTLAARNSAIAPLIAETGGQNAMIIDSSALLEQATDNIINSAFGSVGQRCSALRVAYIQEEIYQPLINLIKGAMNELKIGDTEDFTNDLGPVISQFAKDELNDHVKEMKQAGFEIIAAHKDASNPKYSQGSFFLPHMIKINHISDLKKENFGPILHVKSYKSSELEQVIEEINSTEFGLTFGIQSRIEEKINYISERAKAGNIYANRTIVGAQVGTQPFGGEGKSGTGFKAGGPFYLLRFTTERVLTINTTAIGGNVELLKNK